MFKFSGLSSTVLSLVYSLGVLHDRSTDTRTEIGAHGEDTREGKQIHGVEGRAGVDRQRDRRVGEAEPRDSRQARLLLPAAQISPVCRWLFLAWVPQMRAEHSEN